MDSNYFGQDKWGRCIHPHFFWIPLLGLYTGARLEEIAQLYVEDIKLIEGVHSLDFIENKPDKSVKPGAERVVPLHDFLVQDLKFIGYIKSLPQDGRVFPALKRVSYRYGKAPAGLAREKCQRTTCSHIINASNCIDVASVIVHRDTQR